MLDLREMKWMLRGACATFKANPDIFYEEGNETTAKAFCAICPVIMRCREWAMTHDEYGVWGGTSDADRRAVRRVRMRKYCPTCGKGFLHRIEKSQICLSCGSSWGI